MADPIQSFEQKAELCAACEEAEAKLDFKQHRFHLGSEADGVVLSAVVPVWSCAECGEEYLAPEAEEMIHDVICAHLGRLNPAEIKAMRVKFAMRQEEFAALTGYGIASVKRWESGNQIQSESVDKHLRLLRALGAIEATKRIAPRPAPAYKHEFGREYHEFADRFRLRTPSYELLKEAA